MMKRTRNAKIIATLGPGRSSEKDIADLIEANFLEGIIVVPRDHLTVSGHHQIGLELPGEKDRGILDERGEAIARRIRLLGELLPIVDGPDGRDLLLVRLDLLEPQLVAGGGEQLLEGPEVLELLSQVSVHRGQRLRRQPVIELSKARGEPPGGLPFEEDDEHEEIDSVS